MSTTSITGDKNCCCEPASEPKAAPAADEGTWLQRFVSKAATGASGSDVLSNVAQAGNLGQTAASEVVKGASSVVTSAVGAGAKIGEALLSGALQPFGKSGAAVSSFASQLSKMAQDGLGGALGLVGRVAGAGGQLAGAAVGVAGAGVGALAGGLVGAVTGSAPGLILGATLGSLVGVAMMRVIESIAGAVSGALEAVGQAFGAFGDLVSGALKTISDVLSDCINTSVAYAQQILAVSQSSGVGLAEVSKNVNNLIGLGVNPEQASGMKANSWSESMRGGAYNVSGSFGSEEFLRTFRAAYQDMSKQGAQGLMMAQHMAKNLGAESLVPTANLSSEQFNRQMTRSSQMQSAFGMNPQQVAEAGQNFSLLMASVSQFANLAKMKIANELLPYLTNVLNMAIGYVSAHAGDISSAIKTGVSWVVEELPVYLLNFVAGVLSGFSTLLSGFSVFTAGLAANVEPILAGIDAVINGMREFAANVSGVVSAIAFVVNSMGGLSGLANAAGAAMGARAIAPIVRTVGKIVGKGAAAEAAEGAGGLSTMGKIGRVLGTGVKFLTTTETGAGIIPTFGGIASAISGATVAAGVAVGGLGYEAMRKTNFMGYGAMPSSWQIAKHYLGGEGDPPPAAKAAADAAVTTPKPATVALGAPKPGGSSVVPATSAAAASVAPAAPQSIGEAFTQGFNRVPAFVSNLAGNSELVGTLRKDLNRVSVGAADGAKTTRDLSNGAQKEADGWPQHFKEMNGHLKNISKSTDTMAKLHEKANAGHGGAQAAVGVINAIWAEHMVLANQRS